MVFLTIPLYDKHYCLSKGLAKMPKTFELEKSKN